MSKKSASPGTQLKRAIKAGDFDEARRLLAEGVEPDLQWIYDFIIDRKTDQVRFLLELGIDPAKENPKHSYNPAEYAIMQGRAESVRLMLEHGLNPNAPAQGHIGSLFQQALSEEYSPLEFEERDQENRIEIVDLLIEYGADLQAVDDKGYGPVAQAMRADHNDEIGRAKKLEAIGASTRGVECFKAQARFRADPSAFGVEDLKALKPDELSMLLPGLLSRPDLIQPAIEFGADPDYPRLPPLIYATQSNNLDAIKALLDAGADINVRDRDGVSPLNWAQFNGYEQVVALLRERGARTFSHAPYHKRRGVSDVEGNVWSLCVKADAETAARAVCELTGGRVIRDVLRQRHAVGKTKYTAVVQFKGHAWSYVLTREDRRLMEAWLAEEAGLETLVLDCAKTASVMAYRYRKDGVLAEWYSEGDTIEFSSTLGTRKPRRLSKPEVVFDRAFKRFDAWAIETGLVSGPDKEGVLFVDIAYTNPDDFEAVHLVIPNE